VPTTPWTAKTLVKRTFALLRRHPIFALPVLIADLLGFAAMHFQHALHGPLFALFFSTKDSVLSTTRSSFILTPENATKAALLIVPLIWGCYFLTIYFYSGALVVVSALLETAQKGEILNLQLVQTVLLKRKRRILGFSIFLFGVLVIAAVVGYWLFRAIVSVPWFATWTGFNEGILVAGLLEMPIAYIFTRRALKFLRPEAMQRRSDERLATFSGFAAVTVQIVVSLLWRYAAPAFLFQQTTVAAFLFREATFSLIGALLYVPLFVALSLLATGEEPMIEAPVFQGVET
jgi:hypothetical protein